MVRVVPVCCCSCCCALVIFAVAAIPLSFKTLEQGKYAIQLNWSTQKVSDEVVKNPGMYMVGLGNVMIEYPSTFQNMYFVDAGGGSQEFDINRPAIRARSKDGLEMRISVSFQWKFEPSSLLPVYAILGGGATVEEGNLYRDEFVRFARGALVESCALFGAAEYFTNRTEITTVMYEKVRIAFYKPEKNLIVSIKGLQLREVALPPKFDEEIVQTQKELQEVQVAVAERTEKEIIMQRNMAVMQQRVLQMEIDAQGVAQETLNVNAAIVAQKLVLAEESAFANALILEQLNQSISKGADPYQRLFEVMQVGAVNGHDSRHLLLDI